MFLFSFTFTYFQYYTIPSHAAPWYTDSAPRLGVYYFLSLSVCMSRCSFKLLLLLCFSVEWSHFCPPVLHVALYKTVFFHFWFRPPKPQNLLSKIWHKIDYNSACMADRQKMFGRTRGFSGMADSMEPCNMLWGRPLLPWQRHLC